MKDSYLQVAPAHRSGAASIPPLPPVWVGFGLAAASFFAELASAALPDARVGLVLVPLAGSIYWLACIYRFHSVIRAWSNETYAIKPAMALFGNFIPIFNIYWMVKWPIEMSTYINRQSSIRMVHGGWLGLALLVSIGIGRTVSSALALAGVFAAAAYIRSKLEELTRDDLARPATSRLACPNCGDLYDPADYREDAEHIYCSSCKAEVPRAAWRQAQRSEGR
jgi:hypothetical protein